MPRRRQPSFPADPLLMPAPSTTAERLLRAARTLFEREGAEAVSMRKVAAKAGVTPMAIYRHFDSRDALLWRICDDAFEEITRHWQARAQGGDPLQRVLATQRIYLDFALAHPHLFDYAFGIQRGQARRFPEDFRERRSPTLTVVADAVEDAMQAGALRRDDAWDVAMTLWAHTHGLVSLYRAGRFSLGEPAFRVFYDTSLTRLLSGLRA